MTPEQKKEMLQCVDFLKARIEGDTDTDLLYRLSGIITNRLVEIYKTESKTVDKFRALML